MIVKLPKTVESLINELPENDIMFIAFMHMLKTMYPNYTWFHIWRYDAAVIVNAFATGMLPNSMFKRLRKIFTIGLVNDTRLDVKFIVHTEKEFDYEITDYRNVVLWSHILDQGSTGNYNEYPHNIPKSTYVSVAAKEKRHFVSALKSQAKVYDTKRVRK